MLYAKAQQASHFCKSVKFSMQAQDDIDEDDIGILALSLDWIASSPFNVKANCCNFVIYSVTQHAKKCGSGTSVILDINASIIAIIRGKRATLWGSVYLDEHGEEDRDLK